jgi:hypothetical protein
MWLEEREAMTIKFNITQSKLRSVGTPVGKRTLDSMILDTINHYAPATHSSGYSAVNAGSSSRHVEGEEYDLADLQGLLQRERIQSEPEAQESTSPPSMFQEFATPEQQNFEAPAYEASNEFEPAAMQATEEQCDFEVPVDEEFSEFEANILPTNPSQPTYEEPVYEGLSPIEAEVLKAATPDPEAPQACFDDAELSSACPNVMRTRRGTIAFVRHEIGTYINPVYNKCGILVRVDLNGITLCRRAADQMWSIVDTDGDEILSSGIRAVYFDRQGNLITVNSNGRKMMIGVDGAIHNS